MIQTGGTGCFKSYTIRKNLSIDFIYIGKTYDGLYMSNPDRIALEEAYYINQAKNTYNQITNRNTEKVPFIILPKYQVDFPKVLKTRLCIASLSLNCTALSVIWFDDGDKDVYQSLDEIYDEIDWELGIKYEY